MIWKQPTLGLSTLAVTAVFAVAQAHATFVFFDLENDGAAGPALEELGTFTDGGVTVNATATGGELNSLASSFGVDGPASGATDDSDQIDAALGESITFVFVFTGLTVSLSSLDFVGVGPGANDTVFFAINDGAVTQLDASLAEFNGTTDVFTPTTPIALLSGDTLTITAEDVAGIEGFTLEVIPEPGALALMSLGGLAVLGRRRKA